MKIRVLAFILVIALTSTTAHAQSKEQGAGYFSKDWVKVTKPTEAAYYRTVQANNDSSAYIVRDYFVPSAKLHQEVTCSQLAPSVVFHGKLKRYYLDGTLQEEGQYERGNATGVFFTYYNTGKPCETREYAAGTLIRILQYYTADGLEQIVYDEHGVAQRIDSHKDSVYAEGYHYPYYINSGDTIYVAAEKKTEHQGGMDGMVSFLSKNMTYPSQARRKGIEGTVFTMFIVDEQGKIHDPTVVRSVSRELDAEALRVIRLMKPWQPALIRGKAVKTRFVLPLKFRLA
jgi:TonB family protein